MNWEVLSRTEMMTTDKKKHSWANHMEYINRELCHVIMQTIKTKLKFDD